MKRVIIIIFSLNKNKRYWLEWPSLLCNRKKKCLAILPSNQRFILTIFFSLLSFLYTSSYMKIFHVLFSIVKNLVCQSKIINVFNFSFAAQSVHYNLYLSDNVHLPLFKFLSYGTSIYSIFIVFSEMENFQLRRKFRVLFSFFAKFRINMGHDSREAHMVLGGR